MKTVCAWLGLAMLVMLASASPAQAQANDPLKPYVVLMLDTSGSMNAATGSGPPTCGGTDTRLNHAKCAINRIVNSYGDMVFAFARFRENSTGTFVTSCDADGDNDGYETPADDCNTTQPVAAECGNCSCDGSDLACPAGCTTAMRADSRAQMLTALVDGNNHLAGYLTDFACGTCSLPSVGNPPTAVNEIWGAGSDTPLGGSLLGVWRYWQGLQATDGTPIWPAAAGAAGGFDPIRNDPRRTSFLPTGCDPNPATCGGNCCTKQCRPYITILLTDGQETCGGDAETAASNLLNSTVIDNRQYRIETKVIGFGISAGDPDVEEVATLGSLTPNPVGNDGFYASDEAGVQLAISQILDDAIRTEICNNADDDCDNISDEGFTKGTSCNNNLLGVCRVTGVTECRGDGAGTQCDAGREPECDGAANGTNCTVVNSAGSSRNGTCQNEVCIPTALGTPGNPNNEQPLGCNLLDDDCDGLVDENVTGCVCNPSTEICDGDDDDCDGNIDEGTAVPCGTGTCLGVRPCLGSAGLGPCNANTPNPAGEICNGADDTCDGIIDGIQESCSNMHCPGGSCTGGVAGQRTCVGGARNGLRCDTFPAFDPRNNPGGNAASACELLGAACICNPGNRTCPQGGNGTWSSCVQEIEPSVEICNALDDDCDGLIDETPTTTCTVDANCPPMQPVCNNPTMAANAGTCEFADCSLNSCGGELRCENGMQKCTLVTGVDDTCNGVDEDCDGMVDDNWMCQDPDGVDNIPGNMDDCPCTVVGQCNAKESCENGGVVCQGDPTGQESCNCADDDCDGNIDENPNTLCPNGAACTNCQCAFQCIPGEFACPMGKICMGGYCIADPCFNFSCMQEPGELIVCRPKMNNPADKECVPACDTVTCAAPNICYKPTGECKPDNCTTFPEYCQTDENCINGTCIRNACQNVNCPDGQHCVDGQCYGSCAGVVCPDGERCILGTCQEQACDPPCPRGRYCQDDGSGCLAEPCSFVVCPQGQWCNPYKNGVCEDDPCSIFEIECADGEVCKGGTCDFPYSPDAGEPTLVTTGGGGGCQTGGDAGGALALLLAGGLVATMRRRRSIYLRTASGAAARPRPMDRRARPCARAPWAEGIPAGRSGPPDLAASGGAR